MARQYSNVDFAVHEARNMVVHNAVAASPPATYTATKGQLWFDSTNNVLMNYNGSAWVQVGEIGVGGAGLLKTGSTYDVELITGGTSGVAGLMFDTSGAAGKLGIDPNIVPRKGVANTFGATQTISTSGPNLILDIGTSGAEPWIQFKEGGTVRGTFQERNDGFHLQATASSAPIRLESLTGTIDLLGTAVNVSSVISGVNTPVSGTDAANKNYVDGVVQGLDVKASVKAATTPAIGNITLAGSAPNTLDGVTLAVNDRILVKDQTTTSQNGIYYVSTLGTGANGTWTRATDADANGEISDGTFTFVELGTVNDNTGWTVTVVGGTLPWVPGTNSTTWTQFSGAGTYTAGTGLSLTGTQFAVSSANLLALHGLSGSAGLFPYFTGAGTMTTAGSSTGGRALLNTTGTANTFPYYSATDTISSQAITAGGRALGALTYATDTIGYATSSSAAATTTLSSFGRTLIDDADATAGRATLVAAGTGVTNTFTLPQIIDLTASGTPALTLDVNASAEQFLYFTQGGSYRGTIKESSGGMLLLSPQGITIQSGGSTGVAFSSATSIVDFGVARLTSVVDPTGAQDAVTRNYQDLYGNTRVRVASTANVTIATPGASIDGVTLSNGDRVLLKNQSTASENGIYIFNGSGSAMTRASDSNSSANLRGKLITVYEGTSAGLSYQNTNSSAISIGSTNITYGGPHTRVDRTNTFTVPQIIDLGATGTALTLDVHTGGGENWLVFTEGGTTRGWIQEGSDGIFFRAHTGAMTLVSSADVVLSALGLDVNNVRVKNVSPSSVTTPTAATDALNQNSGDALYGRLTASTTDTTNHGIVRKYTANVGNGSLTDWVLNHTLNTRDVTVQVIRSTTPYDMIDVDWDATDANNVTLHFVGSAPTSAEFRAIVHA